MQQQFRAGVFGGIFVDLLKVADSCNARIWRNSDNMYTSNVEDKFMKVEILDSMFKNCSSKQGTCCTAGESCKGVDLQMVKCTVSERFSQRN